ncbi:hypothetical protein NQ315_016065 [Exocentrus adspersus]|uniref:CCHC-type domain-containing protein n=1 Tax=Exocentrus adspersus TaxID=1586481 RepID=A0AAV8VKK4_9CUCU|nr:hypothetical protein NQ315_016065 [Exocentrus adspersus]
MMDVHRMAFMKMYEETVHLLEAATSATDEFFEPGDLVGNMRVLDKKMESIQNLDKQMLDLMLESDVSAEEVEAEVSNADNIVGKYNRLKAKIERHVNKESLSDNNSQNSSGLNKRKVKLPQIELKKFSGEIKDWLSFWAQFSRIHEDECMQNADKFHYLIQSTIPKSRARLLVESYPQTAENYPKVIESVKSRFGRDDLLIEVYVRELLKLVLSNLNAKTRLSDLYDNIESHLRSLETLGINTDKCAAMLYPLVESCLPEDILRVWQRSTNYDSKLTLKLRLERLMEFLRNEVENEEKISLAKTSFGFYEKRRNVDSHKDISIPTASGLISQNKTLKCAFCKNSHVTSECQDDRMKEMSLNEKRKILLNNGRCYLCLKFGHVARKCAVKLACSICKGRHATIMCTQKEKRDNDVQVENLSNTTPDHTFLQTLIVKVYAKDNSRLVRAMIDTGSQRSYISKQVASEMGYESKGSEQIIHALFGGESTNVIQHEIYKVQLKSLEETYACKFDALDQAVICNSVLCIGDGPWTKELAELNIDLSDTQAGPIEILLGSDIAGNLFTGKQHQLSCGLVAMETKLGWVLMGKITREVNYIARSSNMTISSLFCKNDLSILWNLDVLGIKDPIEKKTKEKADRESIQKIWDKIEINSDGRYEVGLTWIEGHPPLENNFDSVKRRLDNLMKKLDRDGYYDIYNEVFNDWIQEEIIEEVTMSDMKEEGCYYLPHRHVVKLNSATTKLRPVFDASAKEKKLPSLNQCLDKGINLIELIPSILIRFRLHKIGVVSDIRKAFLQISLKKEERSFLRFLWYDVDKNLKVFQHKRVVFGVTCSPFLLAVVIEYHLDKIMNNPENTYNKDMVLKLKKGFYVDNCVTSVSSEEELHQFMKEATDIMLEGKFYLRSWEYSISKPVNDTLDTILSPVLGLIWNRSMDTLGINFDWLKNIQDENITKRYILSIAHRIFDPIGFTSPVQIIPRKLLQRTWLLKTNWDEEIPNEIREEFMSWAQNFVTNENEILDEKRSEESLSFFNVMKDLSRFYSYFSKYIKNLRQMAWIRRFIFNCKCENKNKRLGCLSADEIMEAEEYLLKIAQQESFKGVTDRSIMSLNPFIDEKGIIRIKTRLTGRNDTEEFKNPILLPSKHFITKKLICHYHLEMYHVGVQGLMCKLREKFWIINSRRTIKKFVKGLIQEKLIYIHLHYRVIELEMLQYLKSLELT